MDRAGARSAGVPPSVRARRRTRLVLLAALLPALGAALWQTKAGRWAEQAVELARAERGPSGHRGDARTAAGLPRLIAHAGGAAGGTAYSNSLEALEENYARGLRAFEVDLEWTRDGRLVLVHDWDFRFRLLFPAAGAGVPTRDGFLGLPMAGGLTPLDLDGLAAWLDGHPDALVVTDVKRDNLRALERIAADHARLRDRIIPQIYAFDEYGPVRALGFRSILLTLYRRPYFDGLVVRFARGRDLAGVVMDSGRAAGGLAGRLASGGVPVFVHTVNDAAERRRLEAAGAYGIMTDTLAEGGP